MIASEPEVVAPHNAGNSIFGLVAALAAGPRPFQHVKARVSVKPPEQKQFSFPEMKAGVCFAWSGNRRHETRAGMRRARQHRRERRIERRFFVSGLRCAERTAPVTSVLELRGALSRESFCAGGRVPQSRVVFAPRSSSLAAARTNLEEAGRIALICVDRKLVDGSMPHLDESRPNGP